MTGILAVERGRLWLVLGQVLGQVAEVAELGRCGWPSVSRLMRLETDRQQTAGTTLAYRTASHPGHQAIGDEQPLRRGAPHSSPKSKLQSVQWCASVSGDGQ
jgi:hypothetical protein